jgi:hypothetical protein
VSGAVAALSGDWIFFDSSVSVSISHRHQLNHRFHTEAFQNPHFLQGERQNNKTGCRTGCRSGAQKTSTLCIYFISLPVSINTIPGYRKQEGNLDLFTNANQDVHFHPLLILPVLSNSHCHPPRNKIYFPPRPHPSPIPLATPSPTWYDCH